MEQVAKPLRKLHKLLGDFPAQPSPEEVHDLRTRVRRLEAIVHTCSSDSDRDARRLLKLVKPVRKAAGKVRDMDVFIAKIHEVRMEPDGDGMVRLTEHIAGLREKQLARLHGAIARHRKQTLRCIKQYVRSLESSLESGSGEVSPAAPQMLAARLDNWPKLHADNLHEFRIHAKELRYMLQLVPNADPKRMDALSELKDVAGEWHDWLELHNMAQEVLDTESDRQILQQFSAMTREKLRAGLTAANRLRRLSVELPQAA